MTQDRGRSRAKELHDQRETICQVIAGPAIEPHPGAVLPGDHPKPVMLDFVQPQLARRRAFGFGGQARRNEAWR